MGRKRRCEVRKEVGVKVGAKSGGRETGVRQAVGGWGGRRCKVRRK